MWKWKTRETSSTFAIELHPMTMLFSETNDQEIYKVLRKMKTIESLKHLLLNLQIKLKTTTLLISVLHKLGFEAKGDNPRVLIFVKDKEVDNVVFDPYKQLGDVNTENPFGDTAELFKEIGQDELKSKLETLNISPAPSASAPVIIGVCILTYPFLIVAKAKLKPHKKKSTF